MPGAITSQNPERPHRAAADNRRRSYGDDTGEACGNPVEDIIEARRGPPEVPVLGIAVADHRIQRVGRPIRQQPRNPRHRTPEQRRHHGIRGVLSHRLHHRPRNLIGIQPPRIPPTQMRQPLPRRRKITATQRLPDSRSLTPQRSPTQHSPRSRSSQSSTNHRPPPPDPLSRNPHHPRPRNKHPGISHPRTPRIRIQNPPHPRSHPPKPRHRMPPPRIPKAPISHKPHRQPHHPRRRSHPANLATPPHPPATTPHPTPTPPRELRTNPPDHLAHTGQPRHRSAAPRHHALARTSPAEPANQPA